ncbi:DNA damage-regulated autophagy modulator protein 2-like [Saccostrea cucullata]|uniref:DNA damage-regulated autophagy modulator protein 2-like n=1 Tax=Saccostrea cuccullata TaxID=36930 RepID=UPI002ED1FD8B
MCVDKLYLLPVAFVVLLPVTFLITYAIAVSDEEVAPFFPFISDTGTLPPESCIFGQLLNIAAVLILIVIYLRYKQITAYIAITNLTRPSPRTNTGFFVLGLLSGIGLSIVANFQVENSKGIHIVGAVLAFIVGGAYFFTQTYISWIFRDIPGFTKTILVTRLVICILYASFFIIGVATFVVSKRKLGKQKISTRLWTSDYKGYPEHVVSSVVEWLGSFLICVYVATFIPEFKHMRLETKWQLELATGELQPVV